jgi:predicted ATPase/DNA-binding SARP family transcriptional activator
MSVLSVHFFGVPRIERDGVPVTVERRKSLALLAYLAVTRQPHSRDALATLLWPDADAERARAGLRRTLVDLNTALGKGWLDAEGDQIVLRADAGLQVDVERYHAVLAQVAGHSHPPHRLCDACLAHLTEAASLYTADFLAGFTLGDAVDFDAWQTFQTESLRLELAGALEKLAQGLAGRQQWDAAISAARRWLALDPLHEPAHRLLMHLHAWAGDRAAAARQYQECVKVMETELCIEPEPETTALLEAIRSGAAGEPSSAYPFSLSSAPTHNLPPDPTPFIGREREMAQIAARLADPACRLLTIVGPGGMGKTRLALQAAREQSEVFAHGVWFVGLAPVTSTDLLPAIILQALGVAAAAGDVATQLARHLRDKHLLLMLDNFEHLAEEATLLSKLLVGAPKLKLLVTSRSRLNLHEEWLVPLEGMEVPDERDPHPSPLPPREREHTPSPRGGEGRGEGNSCAATLEHYSATALFLGCVRRLRPDFQPTPTDARHISHICRLLDGMPLAIELAAAWHRTLPLGEIAREVERGLGLLATKARDVPERQRSMTATFDYSWRLLSPHERSIMRQASVFRGGFTRAAAEGIAGATLVDLDSLFDASWISLRASGRYELHELIRQYCADKLAVEHASESGEMPDQVRDRHAAFYRSLLLAQQRRLNLQPETFPELAAELVNLLAAWDWFVAQDDLDAVRTMVFGLNVIALLQGWGRAFARRVEACAQQLKAGSVGRTPSPDRGSEHTLVQATLLVGLLFGELLASRELWDAREEEAISLLAQEGTSDERWQEVRWLLKYGMAQGKRKWGNNAEARDLCRTLLLELEENRFELWPYSDDARYSWQIDVGKTLGYCVLYQGDYVEARRVVEQSITLAKRIGAEEPRWECEMVRAEELLYADDCREAEKTAREWLRACRAVGYTGGLAWSFWIMGMARAGLGSYVRAQVFLRQALTLARENGNVLTAYLHHLGNVELALGNLMEARRLYRELMALCEESGLSYGVVVSLTGLARVALGQGDLVRAKEYLLRALPLEMHSRPIQHTIEAIATMTELIQAEGQLETAAELCAALLSWPATPKYAPNIVQHLRSELEARLQDLQTHLPPQVFAAATARGRARQIDDVVAELVGEKPTGGQIGA